MAVQLPNTMPEDVRAKLQAVLGTDVTLLGPHWEFIGQCLGVVGGAQQYIDAADFALEFTNFVKAGQFVSRTAGILSAADLVLGPLGNLIALMKASVSGREAFAYAGVCYGTTSWAFDHKTPRPSPKRMENLMKSKPQERGLWEQSWKMGVTEVQQKLEQMSVGVPNKKKTLHVVLRAMGNDDPAELNYRLMEAMAPKLQAMGAAHLANWKYYSENVLYPN